MPTIDQILDASREGKRLTKLAKWNILTALIQQHIDDAYMLGEETARRHLEAMYGEKAVRRLTRDQKDLEYWQGWYDEALRRLKMWEKYHAKQGRRK